MVNPKLKQQDRLQRCSDWVHAWTPWVLARWCLRHRLILTAAGLATAALLLGAAHAGADPGTGASVSDGDFQISWMGIKDSHGVPVAKYTLTLNQGSAKNPTYAVFAAADSIVYEIYLCLTATALWLITFVLKFKWLNLFTEPFHTIGDGITTAMDRYGLAPSALAVLAIIAACTALASKTAKAFSHIGMGMLMIGVAATIFAHPLAELIGSDGLLAKGRDTGLQIASTVSDGAMHNKGAGADIDGIVSRLADRFLRQPTQMINFGMVSDSISRKCQEAWSNGIKNSHGDNLKDDIKGCDDEKGKAMHTKAMAHPSAIFASLLISEFLGAFLIAFACYFVWHVVRAALHAMLFASLAPPAFAVGVIPGGLTTFAWKTVLDCAMAYVAMIVYTAAFGAYNVVLDKVFVSTNNPAEAMFLTALVLAFAFAFFGPLRRMFDRQRDTMAAKLGGGSASSRSSAGWLSKAADLSQIRQLRGRRSKRPPPPPPPRIEPESESAGTGGGGGGPRPVSVSESAGDSGSVSGPGADTGSGASSVEAASDVQPAPQRVLYLKHERAAEAHDRLAEAIRLQRGNRGGGTGPSGPPSGGGRYALSEAA